MFFEILLNSPEFFGILRNSKFFEILRNSSEFFEILRNSSLRFAFLWPVFSWVGLESFGMSLSLLSCGIEILVGQGPGDKANQPARQAPPSHQARHLNRVQPLDSQPQCKFFMREIGKSWFCTGLKTKKLFDV